MIMGIVVAPPLPAAVTFVAPGNVMNWGSAPLAPTSAAEGAAAIIGNLVAVVEMI